MRHTFLLYELALNFVWLYSSPRIARAARMTPLKTNESTIAMTTPLAAVAVSSVAGGALASHILQEHKNKKNELFSKDNLKRYLRQEIVRRSNSINQKQLAIERLQREITIDQQQITECNLAISKLDKEKYQE